MDTCQRCVTLSSSIKRPPRANPPSLHRQNARKLLQLVPDTLSTVTSALPYPSAISLVAKISTVADLLLSSSPLSTPPISNLPAELFSRIVHFCQDDNVRLRQNTNLALSRTSRSFYLAVQAVLAAEAHLFTTSQLITLRG